MTYRVKSEAVVPANAGTQHFVLPGTSANYRIPRLRGV